MSTTHYDRQSKRLSGHFITRHFTTLRFFIADRVPHQIESTHRKPTNVTYRGNQLSVSWGVTQSLIHRPDCQSIPPPTTRISLINTWTVALKLVHFQLHTPKPCCLSHTIRSPGREPALAYRKHADESPGP